MRIRRSWYGVGYGVEYQPPQNSQGLGLAAARMLLVAMRNDRRSGSCYRVGYNPPQDSKGDGSRLLLDRGCRDAVDSHAESFGSHVARVSYRVECTPPQNSQGRGLGSPSNSGTGHCWLGTIRRSRCNRVECNPPQDSTDRIRGLL